MYNQEFSLETTKWIFRSEDMSLEEEQLWIHHLKTKGFNIEDSREIFTPFTGEKAVFLNEDIGTQELRVRMWNWTDSNNKQHKILDINAWPDDNESGVIAFDGKAIISNSEQHLSWLPNDCLDFSGFDDRLEFFSEIRKHLADDYWCWSDESQFKEDYDKFFSGEAGKNAIMLERIACENYHNKIEAIEQKQKFLKEKYLHEFNLLERLPVTISSNIANITEVADKIGYDLEPGINGKIDNHTDFSFIQWTHYNTCFKLVTITRNYKSDTFLLNSLGKIIFQVYKGDYLTDVYDGNNAIHRSLAKRIHSYLEVMWGEYRRPNYNIVTSFSSNEITPLIPLYFKNY